MVEARSSNKYDPSTTAVLSKACDSSERSLFNALLTSAWWCRYAVSGDGTDWAFGHVASYVPGDTAGRRYFPAAFAAPAATPPTSTATATQKTNPND
eukprot:COSAG05_NODE_7789_length_770_cov_0.770492_1_plen_96_part_10